MVMSRYNFESRGVSDAENERQANAERQQRKILAAMALSHDGKIDTSALDNYDVEMDDNVRSEIIDKMSAGEYGESLERQILEYIPGPVDRNGAESVSLSLSSERERELLETMTYGAGSVAAFLAHYPTPMDFEDSSAGYLELVEEAQGADVRRHYESAMDSLKQKIFGKKQEYWKQMQALNAEAARAKKNHDSAGEA